MKKKKSSPTCDRWKPVRRGEIYCSPGCGRNCTYEEFLKASLESEKLARRCGPNFEPHVWENLGWHYSAVSKNNSIKIHPSYGRNQYNGYFGAMNSCGGEFTASGTLNDILKSGLEEAKSRATYATNLVTAIQISLKNK